MFSLNTHVAAVLFKKPPVYEKQEKKKGDSENRGACCRLLHNTFLSCEDVVIDVLTTTPSYLW